MKRLTDFQERIEKELPIINLGSTIKDAGTGGILKTISYKDTTNWCILSNFSEALAALANKICDMITKGRGIDVPVLLDRIVNKGTKKLSKPDVFKMGEFLGYGHFRWHFRAWTLDDRELNRLKEFFGI